MTHMIFFEVIFLISHHFFIYPFPLPPTVNIYPHIHLCLSTAFLPPPHHHHHQQVPVTHWWSFLAFHPPHGPPLPPSSPSDSLVVYYATQRAAATRTGPDDIIWAIGRSFSFHLCFFNTNYCFYSLLCKIEGSSDGNRPK